MRVNRLLYSTSHTLDVHEIPFCGPRTEPPRPGTLLVAYTFDAGPNAFLLTLADDAPLVLSLLAECFGQVEVGNGEGLRCYGDDLDIKRARFETQARRLEVRGIQYSLEVDLDNHREVLRSLPRCAGSIQYILSTEIGPGPQVLSKTM